MFTINKIRTLPFYALIGFFLTAVLALSAYGQDDDGKKDDGSSVVAGGGAVDEHGLPSDQALIDQGKTLFLGNCASCHAVHTKKVGPALKDVYDRQSLPWLINFIKYPQKVINSGDAYAVALFKEYNQVMPGQDWASDDEIKSILAWVKYETSAQETLKKAGGGGAGAAGGSSSGDNGTVMFLMVMMGAMLFVALVALLTMSVVLKSNLSKRKDLSEEDAELVGQGFNVLAVLKSPGFIGLAVFLFLAYGGKKTVDGMFTIGIQQGYAPDQPIPFSHKLHAGYYEIECVYCHTGVEKSKNANIPSANICMNCHNQIRTTAPNIQKIYQAIETNTPIQWVRVHNLPDLSYFNHQQHVVAGGIACETCHGDIKNMEIVQQHSILTMGWCIACHRKTQVQTKDNGYYDRLLELHEKKSKKALTVQDIGGLECGKCHY